MARKKVSLQWISNSATRRATYKRRYESLAKKASELTTLCGIKMSVVAYGDDMAQPDVWPSDEEAKGFLKKFKDMPNVGTFKKTQRQEEFLQSRTVRLHEQVSKLDHENRERETLALLHDSLDGRRPGLVGTTKEELISLREMVEMKMSKAKARIQQLAGGQARDLPDPLQVMLPISSPSQMQVPSYTYNEMQIMSPPEGHQLQQGWPLPSLAPDYGELGAVLYGGFASSSRDPSGSGSQMMQPYNLGSSSGLSWPQ